MVRRSAGPGPRTLGRQQSGGPAGPGKHRDRQAGRVRRQAGRRVAVGGWARQVRPECPPSGPTIGEDGDRTQDREEPACGRRGTAWCRRRSGDRAGPTGHRQGRRQAVRRTGRWVRQCGLEGPGCVRPECPPGSGWRAPGVCGRSAPLERRRGTGQGMCGLRAPPAVRDGGGNLGLEEWIGAAGQGMCGLRAPPAAGIG